MRKIIFLFIFLLIGQASAEIKIYESTDNTGINKLERIEVVEKYLTDISQSLKSMEAKLDANTIKLKTLDDIVTAIKEKDLKNIMSQLGERSATAVTAKKDEEELSKIKADIITMKNDDIEKIKLDLQALSSAVKQLEK